MEIARSRLWILRMNKYEGENARKTRELFKLAGKILKKQPIWREIKIKGPKSDEQIKITR